MHQPQPAPAPAKKKHTGLKFAAGFGAFVVLVGGCAAILSDADTTTGTTPTTPPPAATKTSAAPPAVPASPVLRTPAPKPLPADQSKVTVTVGQEFTVGSGRMLEGRYTVLAGWKLASQYGVPSLTGRVRNADDEKASLPNLQVKFVNGSDLVMSFTCTASELEPGQTAKLNCYSSDEFSRGYKTIVAETGL